MNETDLTQIIDTALEAIKTNREVVTPAILDKLEELIQQHENDDTIKILISALLGIDKNDIPDYIEKIEKVISLEKQLVAGQLSDNISDALIKLKRRPLIMKMLAALL